MAMTYQKIMDAVEGVWDARHRADARDKATMDKMRSYYTDDAIFRTLDVPFFLNKEECVHHIADQQFTDMTLSAIPYYWMVDEKKGMAAGYLREEVNDAKTGKIKDDYPIFAHYHFREENGEPKIWLEHHTKICEHFTVPNLDAAPYAVVTAEARKKELAATKGYFTPKFKTAQVLNK